MVEITLEAGSQIVQDLPSRYRCFLYVLAGCGLFGQEQAQAAAGEVVWLSDVEDAVSQDSELVLRGGPKDALRALLWASQPIREPVVARGPFVMNTVEQVVQASADLKAGRFGPALVL
jgi:redox-sensitive bicupin YhaK (pirin superfamily)